MTARRFENVIILDGRSAAILWQAAHLDDLRVQARGRNDELYHVLLEVYQAALHWRTSLDGIQQEKAEETGERSRWTTPQALARKLGVTPRTIRNDIGRRLLPAVKQGRVWVIESSEAETYIAARAA